MDFSLTDEQSMLADSIARFVDNDYDFETRQKIAGSAAGYSSEMWRTFADLGWTAMPFAEEDGGLGGGPVEMMLMMQQFGRGLVLEPFLPSIVLAGGILRRAANREQKERWLTPLIAGEIQAALAFAEPQARFDPADIATTATPDNGDYILNGEKILVLNGGNADLLIVPARTSGARTDRSGITLFALSRPLSRDTHQPRHQPENQPEDTHQSGRQPGDTHQSGALSRDTHQPRQQPEDTHQSGDTQEQAGSQKGLEPADIEGVMHRSYPLVDAHRAANIHLTNVRVRHDAVIGSVDGGWDILWPVIDEATLAVCAEAMGILRTLHEKTVDYAKSRIQFGVPIGSFQALQHRMVDTLMTCEQCQSLLYWATMLAEAGSDETAAAISALKHQIGTGGRRIAQEAVQIHGGMGVTWELDVAHLFKRFSVIETLFGNADFHLDRYIALSA